MMQMDYTSTNMLEAENITRMDPKSYEAAAKGEIGAFEGYPETLDLLLTPNKNTLVHIHLATGREEEEMDSTSFVEEILNKCPSLLWQANANDEIPLHLAARYGLSNITQLLIERAKAPHETDPEKGDVRQMVRMTNQDKDTALHEAVRFNHIEVVKLLIKEDPDLAQLANSAGETPLYLAAGRGFRHLVNEILTTCTLPALRGPHGRTALHAAVISRDGEIVRQILDNFKGAGLTKEADQQGWTPLHYVAHLGYSSMVEPLLEVDTSAAYFADTDGKRTALHIAAQSGNQDVVKKLIRCCPDCCELVDKRGWNFLHFAVDSGNISIVNVVYRYYLLLNEKDNEGNTPLHLLANHRGLGIWDHRWDVADFIKHPRVDKMALNRENLSALDIISANATWDVKWKERITKYLGRAGAKKGGQNITYEDVDKGGKDDVHATYLSEIKKAKETHLIVATLIATVAFAASFTMPGGYSNTGTPALARKAAFDAFVISNAVAMMLSSSAVFICIFLAMPLGDDGKFLYFFSLTAYLNIFAIGAMMVAFMTGQYAVLGHSLGLATCVIASFFFLFFYQLFLTSYGEASFSGLLWKALQTSFDLFVKAREKARGAFFVVIQKRRSPLAPKNLLFIPFAILLLVAIGPFLILFLVAVIAFGGFVIILAVPGLAIEIVKELMVKVRNFGLGLH